MLTEKQINEIRIHLDKAQNPLFFFDSDNDGLMSFLLLQRFIERGKGVVVKGTHNLSESYFRKVNELNPDYVFILDLPKVEQSFFDKVNEKNLPVVWIDHHNMENQEMPKGEYSYYNPYNNDKSNEPVAYLSYKITENKKDIWLAVIGCVSDYYMPDFYEEFREKYPDFAIENPETPYHVFYGSEIGKIARILDFALKDRTTNVINMMRFMMKVKEPVEILQEDSKTRQILKRYNEINKKYQVILDKARMEGEKDGKLLYFEYGGDLSLTSNLSNQLSHEFPKKIIIIIYSNKDSSNVSVRGKFEDVRTITLKAIDGIEGAVGGGHEHATGAKMNTEYLPVFRERIEKSVKELDK